MYSRARSTCFPPCTGGIQEHGRNAIPHVLQGFRDVTKLLSPKYWREPNTSKLKSRRHHLHSVKTRRVYRDG